MTPTYSAPSHSGTQVPYETILLHAWLVVRGANCALRDPARLRENLYQAFERTFTHADGIFNAHSGMASRDMLDDEVARMVRIVGGRGGTLLEKAAGEAVDRCVSAAMGPSRLWHRTFPGMVLNMLLNEIGLDSACSDGVCTVSSGRRTHAVLSGSTWRKEWADAEDGAHIVTLYHDSHVSDEVVHRCRPGRLHLYVPDYVQGLDPCVKCISALPGKLKN